MGISPYTAFQKPQEYRQAEMQSCKQYVLFKFFGMKTESMTLIMVPQEEWQSVVATQQEILQQLRCLSPQNGERVHPKYITAKQFMDAVSIRRTKFDQLVQASKIKIIKKRNLPSNGSANSVCSNLQ